MRCAGVENKQIDQVFQKILKRLNLVNFTNL